MTVLGKKLVEYIDQFPTAADAVEFETYCLSQENLPDCAKAIVNKNAGPEENTAYFEWLLEQVKVQDVDRVTITR